MLEASYFDGKSAIRHAVRLHIDHDELHVEGADVSRSVPLAEVDFGEPLVGAPRCLELPDGGRCEVINEAALARLLAESGVNESRVVRLQRSWRWAIASFLFVLSGSVSAYLWGLPEAARILAAKLPQELVQRVSGDALEQLDRQYFKPSLITVERQQEIRRRSAAFFDGRDLPPWTLHFRESRALGVNAFSLPDGNIVLLDGLTVKLDDDEINAVLAHELGHVVYRHALRSLIESATMSIILAAWLGDVSSAAVGIGGLLLKSGYSRDAELEADAYAASTLLKCCHSTEALQSALTKVNQPSRGSYSLLDSHPDVRQRIAAIRAQQQ